ncbi:Ig-like domain-containing protein, partial [Photobacterium leiognathi]
MMKKYSFSVILSLILSMILVGCNSEGAFEDKDAPLSKLMSIEIIAGPIITKGTSNITVPKGFSQSFQAIGRYSDDTTKDISRSVKWATSNSALATINDEGILTAIAVGDVSVSASSEGVDASTSLIITDAIITSIQVTPAEIKLPVDATQQLVAFATFSDDTGRNVSSEAAWESNDPSIVSVDSNGMLTVKAVGDVIITAKLDNVTSNNATVQGVELSSIQVGAKDTSIAKGLTTQLSATAILSDNSTAVVTTGVKWTSSNEAVATIDNNGVVTGIGKGSVSVTATIDSTTSNALSLTVTDALIVSIAVTPDTVSRPKGLISQLTAIATLTDGTKPNVTSEVKWASDNNVVAAVDNTGVMRAVDTGNATITAVLGGKTSNNVSVTVTGAELNSLNIAPEDVTLPYWKTEQMSAEGIFTDSSKVDMTDDVKWVSSDTAIATISQKGLVRGLTTSGTAEINASFDDIKSLPITITNSAALIDYLKASNTDA